MTISQYHPHRRLLDGVTDTSFPVRNSTTGSTISETNFDSNMVIILAALLCALICALGLNSIVRCAIRCSHRLAAGSSEEAAVRLANAGVKKSVLCQIPVGVYGKEMDIPATECPICLGEFVEGEKVRILPKCSHGFHVKCIDAWLVFRSSCPLCRLFLPESLTGFSVEEVAVTVPATSAGEERL